MGEGRRGEGWLQSVSSNTDRAKQWRRNNRTYLHFQRVIALRELAPRRAQYTYVENETAKGMKKYGILQLKQNERVLL